MKPTIFNFTSSDEDRQEKYYVHPNLESGVLEFYLIGEISSTPRFTTSNTDDSEITLDQEVTKKYFIYNVKQGYKIPGVYSSVDINTMDSNEYFNLVSARKSNIFDDTMAFQKKYGLWNPDVYGFLPPENMKVKLGHLEEELKEIIDGYASGDLAQVCDGLIDLIYVASGTLNLMNVPAQQLWNDVQIRNMQKIRASSGNVGKRGSTFDVIKPEGWQQPRTEDILEAGKIH